MKNLKKGSLVLLLVLTLVMFFTGCEDSTTAEPPADTYEITTEVVYGYGEVELDPQKEAYEEGETVEVTALPEDNWEFDQWKGSLSGVEDSQTVVVDDDLNLIAQFQPAEDITGEGTESNPFVIYTYDGLEKVDSSGYRRDAHYELGYNIDASDEGAFEPIGMLGPDGYNAFTGSFDGNGYAIEDLTIDEEFQAGLFFVLEDAQVENLELDVDFSGHQWVGGLSGLVYGDTIIEEVQIQGEIVAGVIGGEHENIYAGGITGLAEENATIINSSFSGEIEADVEDFSYGGIGGLVGFNYGRIEQSKNTGEIVSSGPPVGGIAAHHHEEIISNSYSTGDLKGPEVGGLIAHNSGVVENSYAAGLLDGEDVGGLIMRGYDEEYDAKVVDSYFDEESTGVEYSDGGEGKTTAEMMQEDTFENWNFNNIWDIEEGESYPYLRW